MNLKKYISLLLICLLLSHGLSHFFVFKVFEAQYKKEIKTMIKEGVPEEQLIKFTFHKSIEKVNIPDFKWIKKNEFRYKKEMYDIVKKETKNDSISYICIHDVKESKLFSNLEKHIDIYLEKNPSKKKDIILIKNSLSKFYYYTAAEVFTRFYDENEFTIILADLLEGENFIQIPPPKV